jgi:predicted phosphoribosyltransferase
VSSRFADLRAGGQALAAAITGRRAYDTAPLVVGIPRGGVPVAAEVAEALGAGLDALVVRKLGVPGQPEVAMGAVLADGRSVLNPSVVRGAGIPEAEVAEVLAAELAHARDLEARWRPDRPPLDFAGRDLVVCDDGLATGATMRAALLALLEADPPPRSIVVGLPVAPREGVEVLRSALRSEVDDVVAVRTPLLFRAVSWAYDDFTPPTDEEIRAILSGTRGRPIA